MTDLTALIARWRQEAQDETVERLPGWTGAEAKLRQCADELERALSTAPAGDERLRELEAKVQAVRDAHAGCEAALDGHGYVNLAANRYKDAMNVLLAAAPVPHVYERVEDSGPTLERVPPDVVKDALGAEEIPVVAPVPQEKECGHGHRQRVSGCVSCVMVFDWPVQAEKESR